MNSVIVKQVRTESKVKPLAEIKKIIDLKRKEELLRFRTCCADVRASK